MDIIIQHDRDNDQCYLAFDLTVLDPGRKATSRRVSEDITLDFDSSGRLVGLDVSNASQVLPYGLEKIRTDALVGVKEAAALAGVQRSNFVRDYANMNGFPPPLAELATGRIWLRSQVEDYLRTRRARAS